MLRKLLSSFAFAAGLAITLTFSSQAAEITLISASALRPAMEVLISEFQKESGHTIKVSYAVIGVVTDRVRKGEQADLAFMSPEQREDLQKEGKVGPAHTTIAKVGVGVFVKNGAAKPDISSADALKRAFLNARSAAFVTAQTNPVAVYTVRLFERLGITAEMNAKNKIVPGQGALPVVGRGDAEIGFTQISEVIAEPAVDFVGPFPAEIQNYTVYATGYPLTAKEPAAAKAFVDFLTSSRASAVFKAKGFEQS